MPNVTGLDYRQLGDLLQEMYTPGVQVALTRPHLAEQYASMWIDEAATVPHYLERNHEYIAPGPPSRLMRIKTTEELQATGWSAGSYDPSIRVSPDSYYNFTSTMQPYCGRIIDWSQGRGDTRGAIHLESILGEACRFYWTELMFIELSIPSAVEVSSTRTPPVEISSSHLPVYSSEPTIGSVVSADTVPRLSSSAGGIVVTEYGDLRYYYNSGPTPVFLGSENAEAGIRLDPGQTLQVRP